MPFGYFLTLARRLASENFTLRTVAQIPTAAQTVIVRATNRNAFNPVHPTFAPAWLCSGATPVLRTDAALATVLASRDR